jgi:hypothetical protein
VALLEQQRPPLDLHPDAEALFKEARRRRRLRRLVGAGIGVLLIGAACAGFFAARHTPVGRAQRPTHPVEPTAVTPARSTPATPALGPQHPYGLAVAPDGSLYLLDTGRDEVLELLPSGGFQVVAGTGQRGFAGDGGPAADAEVDLGTNSAVAVAANGSVFFSDSGNGRVREVEPDGTIETVAGGGPTPLGTAPVSALQASFGQEGPMGLAVGPDGNLYIGATAVYQLTEDGTLVWVVGQPGASSQGISTNPAVQQDFSPAVRLAFDGQGDLLVAGGGGFGLYEDSAGGGLVFVQNFRGDGAWGSMAALPDGDVALSDRDGLSLFQPSGTVTAIPGNLSALLGPMQGSHFSNTFIGGDGVAAGPNNEIYVDADTGNTFTSVNALIEVGSDGTSPKVLWKS